MISSVLVNAEDKEILSFIRQVYEESFPYDERREFEDIEKLLREKPEFKMIAVFAGKSPVGFLSFWEWDSFIYAEHFAIDSKTRGAGYGAEVLRNFLGQTSKPVVLEVEKSEDDFSRRRIGFYERLGLKLWPDCHYIQPPYDDKKKPMELLLMSYGSLDMNKLFGEVRDILHTQVYGVRAGEYI